MEPECLRTWNTSSQSHRSSEGAFTGSSASPESVHNRGSRTESPQWQAFAGIRVVHCSASEPFHPLSSFLGLSPDPAASPSVLRTGDRRVSRPFRTGSDRRPLALASSGAVYSDPVASLSSNLSKVIQIMSDLSQSVSSRRGAISPRVLLAVLATAIASFAFAPIEVPAESAPATPDESARCAVCANRSCNSFTHP